MPAYLDCNATAPLEPAVLEEMQLYFTKEYGNAGSRTHEYGARAKSRVERAREQVARVVGCNAAEVIFTSGATESNNLAILGLASFGEKTGHRHIISSTMEHKAVLEPLEHLVTAGFSITLLPPTSGGWIDPDAIQAALRPETLLVSLMHVNNETGVEQPLEELFEALGDHPCYVHVDAAQGFGKRLAPLQNTRIDFTSVSAHKIYGPRGVGALIARRRGFDRPPLRPLFYGGGQELGLRPGTLPVPLLAGFGKAAEMALSDWKARAESCAAVRNEALVALGELSPLLNGDQERVLPHTLSLSVPGVDAEAVMVALKDLAALSNGSACTSQSYKPSHVLQAMGLSEERISGTIRLSWCHMTPQVDWEGIARRLASLR